MKTSPSWLVLAALAGTLVCGQARAEFPLLSSAAVAGAAGAASQVYRLAQNPATGDLYAAGVLSAGPGNLNIWLARYSPALVLLSSWGSPPATTRGSGCPSASAGSAGSSAPTTPSRRWATSATPIASA